MQTFEKLGAFYLGRVFDPQTRSVSDEPLLYDAKDLTTHAVCVGMTGSGKTGLCVTLLEEAAIDGIPAIVIDPKGDLGNLLLTFPGLQASDFRPWIDESEAARKGQTPDEHAASVAHLWRQGLADWGQDGSRIARFRDAVDLTVFTPGSSAGTPLKVLRSFAAPPASVLDDDDAFRERVGSASSGLLTLLGVDADPLRSREHILLSNLLQQAWQQGRDLEIATLIREIQSPPLERIGVMDLDSFFPSGDRFALSMRLNNLLASPGFSVWMEGQPLRAQDLLWSPDGKPRISILSIAHLSDTERMFFVTLLLSEIVSWMRTQPGTTSLRGLLYMDEVFGYFPPTANPPSKRPMLTLLKQARAYGLGVVLATQNPVDLDYKGLSNAGTWFLGRLQTERDKARILDGLEGATATSGAGFDRPRLDTAISGLKSRVFLMHNVHDTEPVIFHTRWALSYLRGPLTRTQIQRLSTGDRESSTGVPHPPAAATPAPKAPGRKPPGRREIQAGRGTAGQPPVLPAEIEQAFLPWAGSLGEGETLLYRPALLASVQLHYARTRYDVDEWRDVAVMADLPVRATQNVWKGAESLESGEPSLARQADPRATFGKLPAAATRSKSYAQWGKSLKSWLYRERPLPLWRCPELKETSSLGESEGEFRIRLQQRARERRDLAMAKLEKRYAPKLARLRDRIRRADERVAREKSQYGQQKVQTAISVGATVLGALFGRKAASVGTVGRASTAMRGAGRAAREKGDVARAQDELKVQQQKLLDLEREFEDELASVRESTDPAALTLKKTDVRPRKTDIAAGPVRLVWEPWRVTPDGVAVESVGEASKPR